MKTAVKAREMLSVMPLTPLKEDEVKLRAPCARNERHVQDSGDGRVDPIPKTCFRTLSIAQGVNAEAKYARSELGSFIEHCEDTYVVSTAPIQ